MRVRLTGQIWPPHLRGQEFDTTSERPKPSGWFQIADEQGHIWNVNPKTPYGDYGCTILPAHDPKAETLALIRTTIEDGLKADVDPALILGAVLNALED